MNCRLILILAVVLVASCADATVDPGVVVEGYFTAYNAGDLTEVMTFFSDDSEIVGHPTGYGSVTTGSGADWNIERLHVDDLEYGTTYVISNLRSSGPIVTWDSKWGDDGCVEGHEAVVENGIIVSWTWGEFVDCP